MKKSFYCSFLALISMASSLTAGCAADTQKTVDAPGFRPKAEVADGFPADLENAKLTVLPTVVRSREGTEFSEASQKQIVAFLKAKRWGVVESRKAAIDMGEPTGRAQFELFQNDLKRIGEAVARLSGEGTFIVLEHLLSPTPSGEIAVGGIHFYLLDAKGRNVFSFLLNSHHKLFVGADLTSSDTSDEGRMRLIARATETALAALERQVLQNREQ